MPFPYIMDYETYKETYEDEDGEITFEDYQKQIKRNDNRSFIDANIDTETFIDNMIRFADAKEFDESKINRKWKKTTIKFRNQQRATKRTQKASN